MKVFYKKLPIQSPKMNFVQIYKMKTTTYLSDAETEVNDYNMESELSEGEEQENKVQKERQSNFF